MDVKEQKLGIVTNSKYIGAIVSDDVSNPEVLSRIAALKELRSILRDTRYLLGQR